MFMMNLSEKLEAGDDENTIPVENVKTEETENRSSRDDCNENLKTSVNEEYYENDDGGGGKDCLLYTSPSPRDGLLSRMPSSA